MGGKERTRLFVKGNADLLGSLDGDGSIRALVRDKHEGLDVELLAEPSARFDLLLQQLERGAGMPAELQAQGLADDPFTLAQFDSRLFDEQRDVVALSLEPDLRRALWRHRGEGWSFCPQPGWETEWPQSRRAWLEQACEPLGTIDADASQRALTGLVQEIKRRLQAHVVVFNASTIDPQDRTTNFRDVQETLPLRIHTFNRALMEVSVLEGISLVDVDRTIGEMGAGEHILAAMSYSPQAHRALADEFLRILEEIGFFEKRPLVLQVGQKGR